MTQHAPRAGVGVTMLLLRHHPLIGYFALANGFSWLTLFLLGRWLDLPTQLVVLVFTLGPTTAAVIMTAVLDGRSGLRDLQRRIVLWRVKSRWYAVTLLGIPLVIFVATLLTPGASASFAPKSPINWLVTYVVVFVLTGIAGGALFEEVGWRGFALPHLQAQLGPLHGTLVLGGLWAVWHLPQYVVLPEWVAQNGGSDPVSVGAFLLLVLALAPLMTWLVNHTQGSVLIAILAHGSVNTGLLMVPGQLIPTLGTSLVPYAIAFAVVALVLIIRTRGRFGLPCAPQVPADKMRSI